MTPNSTSSLGDRQRRAVQPGVSRRRRQSVHGQRARDPAKTGELVWHYQYIPNESYDFDGSAEPVLADLRIDGRVRKVLLNANKNGFMYVIDRTNGKLIAAHPFVKVNWASHVDLKTGRPVLTDIYERAVKGETVEIWPSRGTNASLMAFNPKTGLVYVNSWEIPAS